MRIKSKIKEKKATKCKNLFMKNQQKNYKKSLLLKKYDEDFEDDLGKEAGPR